MQQQPFEVLSKYTIGKRQSLLVTRHNTRVFLLGVTDSSITLITELDNTDDIDISSVAETQRTDVSAQQFPAWKDLLAQAKERTVRNAR